MDDLLSKQKTKLRAQLEQSGAITTNSTFWENGSPQKVETYCQGTLSSISAFAEDGHLSHRFKLDACGRPFFLVFNDEREEPDGYFFSFNQWWGLSAIEHYVHGVLEGPTLSFDEATGKITGLFSYADGELNGLSYVFDPDTDEIIEEESGFFVDGNRLEPLQDNDKALLVASGIAEDRLNGASSRTIDKIMAFSQAIYDGMDGIPSVAYFQSGQFLKDFIRQDLEETSFRPAFLVARSYVKKATECFQKEKQQHLTNKNKRKSVKL